MLVNLSSVLSEQHKTIKEKTFCLGQGIQKRRNRLSDSDRYSAAS